MGLQLLRGFKAMVVSSVLLFMSPMFFLTQQHRRNGSRALRTRQFGGMNWGPFHTDEKAEPQFSHVRVVIRTQPREALQLRSLIYSLRAQSQGHRWMRVDFVLVPTEPGTLPAYERLKEEINPGFEDLQILELPDSFYWDAKNENPYKCSSSVRAAYVRAEGAADTHKLCDFDHYMYYAATDRALVDHVASCRTCTHFLVTNGDNGYAPSFLGKTMVRHEDVVVVPFVHASTAFHPEAITLGQIDLGAVLLRKKVLEGGKKVFLTSLPSTAKAKEVHDADFWFVKHAVDRGFRHTILSEEGLLMYHH